MSGPRSRWLPSLVSAQVALSLVLLAGAGLFVRTLRNLENVDPGFRADGVLLVDLEDLRTPVSGALLQEIQLLPGVASASLSTHTPLSGWVWSEPAVPAGQPLPEKDTAYFVGAGPRFFATMQIQLLAGRAFTDRDAADGRPVAIVNEAYAQRYLENQYPVGRHLAASVSGRNEDLEVVGLVGNTNAAGLRLPPPPTVYVAYAQLAGNVPTTLLVRAAGSPGRVTSAIQQVLQARLPAAAIDVRPLSAQVEATIVQERMMATLAGAFALLALTLASVGLYGLLSYSVAQRTREIGIRMALGAEGVRVVAMLLEGATRLVLIGIAIGLPAAWVASRYVKSMLFGLTPTDPAVIGGAILLLAAAAELAAFLPARRALRVDPLTALRHE
jgi:predicted permease